MSGADGQTPRGDGAPPEQRIDEWIRTTRALASRLPRRYASLEEAYRRMQQANEHLTPEQAHHQVFLVPVEVIEAVATTISIGRFRPRVPIR